MIIAHINKFKKLIHKSFDLFNLQFSKYSRYQESQDKHPL